jgi:hypothetical protein
MGYEQAIKLAWQALDQLPEVADSVSYLNQEYYLDLKEQKVDPQGMARVLDEHEQILLLHYMAAEGGIGGVSGDRWISFKEMDGGEIYFPSFRKRAVERILAKCGSNPASLYEAMPRLSGEKLDQGSAAITFHPFDKIRMAVIIWAGDDEFPPECNILFNSSIKQILCTEDTAVLGGVVASII